MGDFLVELGRRPTARRMVKQLGLPLPLPVKLVGDTGPGRARPLDGKAVVVAGGPGGSLGSALAHTLAGAGAQAWVLADGEGALAPYRAAGEAYARPPRALAPEAVPAELRPHAILVDLTGLEGPEGLRFAYDALHPRVRGVASCGRVIVLARPSETAPDAAAAAARHALDGFVRSLAKELGAKGITAQLVAVDEGADDRVEEVLRFLLSPRSAFVSGQRVRVRALVERPVPAHVRPLEGKVVMVTGAARGIGAATARALSREGARVVVLDRPEDDGPASRIADEVGGELVLCDLSDPSAPDAVASAVSGRLGGLDAIIHNAGVTRDRTLAKMDEARWQSALGVNLEAVVAVTSRVAPLIREGGRVLCVASIAGIAGNVGQTNYAASKAGILGYVPALAAELAPRGIAVSAVAPGFIETRLTAAIPAATREAGRRLAALGQGGLPEDIAEVLVFLASPGGAALSGEVLRVCGGAFLGK